MIGVDAVYAKDSKRVYFGSEPMGGIIVTPQDSTSLAGATQFTGIIDPSTFTVLTDEFVKDASHVFEMSTQDPGFLVSGADAPTFTLIDGDYEKDKSHVYYEGTMIPSGVDPNTFMPVGNYFAKDAHTIYFGDTAVLPGADPTTFAEIGLDQVDGNRYAKDKAHVYACNYDTGPDQNTYTLECSVVANADPATFVMPTIASPAEIQPDPNTSVPTSPPLGPPNQN